MRFLQKWTLTCITYIIFEITMFEFLSNFKQNIQIKAKEELTLYIRISCFIPRFVIDFCAFKSWWINGLNLQLHDKWYRYFVIYSIEFILNLETSTVFIVLLTNMKMNKFIDIEINKKYYKEVTSVYAY